MRRHTVTQQFRDSATDEDWRQIVADHDELSKEEFHEKYHFSWNSIMDDAVGKGYYERKRKASPAPDPTTLSPENPAHFFVSPVPAGQKKIARSVQLYDSIYTRLQTLENENSQYTRTSILNELLDEALRKYGY